MACINPLVTIAIPFFNNGQYLLYAITSVINQTYRNWELLLVDDGSSDNSREIAEQAVRKDKRIRLFSDGLNKGLAVRLNESVSLAKGDYYARMDADDIMAVDRIEQQVHYLLNNPHVDVVGSSAMIIDRDNRITHSMNYQGVNDGFIHPTVMARTQWFRKNRYHEGLLRSQDYELWLRSGSSSTFYNLTKPLLFYRVYEAQSYQKKVRAFKSLYPIYKDYRKYNKSFMWSIKRCFYSCYKIVVYWVFHQLGFVGYLNKKRWGKELPSELCLSELDLREAIAV